MPTAPDGWTASGDALHRELEFADFAAALAFVNEVGRIAEEANHHPDIAIHGWNKVRLSLTTHDAGGLTGKDHDLAAAVNALPSAPSP